MSNDDADRLPIDERREPSAPGQGAASPAGAPNDAPASKDAKIFRDGNGVTWWAHEVAGEHLGTFGGMCLLVVSAHELRRLWKYPSEWRQLSPADLLSLPQSTGPLRVLPSP
jgi:hypothetical protein